MPVSSRDLVVRELAWDTRHFGVRMGVLETPDGPAETERGGLSAAARAAVAQAAAAGYQQLTARAGPWDTTWIHALESSGFRLVDTLVTWELGLEKPPSVRSASPVLRIRPAAAADVPALRGIAKRAFADRTIWFDRFHADPRMPEGRADALYETWIQNSVTPPTPQDSMADAAWVAETQGVLAGFLTGRLSHTASESLGVVSLNAVDAPYRGRGVYRVLVDTALLWFRQQGCRSVRVRTNVASHPVHRTWQRLGATMVSVEHTFHWWA